MVSSLAHGHTKHVDQDGAKVTVESTIVSGMEDSNNVTVFAFSVSNHAEIQMFGLLLKLTSLKRLLQ